MDELAERLFGHGLKPWQRYAADRITEHRDGVLRWPFAVLTVGRQQGKTYLLAALVAWRLLRGPALFGEAQRVLSMAQKVDVAALVFEQVMRDRLEAEATHTDWAAGRQRARFPDGSDWRVVGSRLSSVTGYSTSMAVVDEAWNVDRDVVVAGVFPQTIQREQPQVIMCSTAGDSRSDLMAHYRDLAQQPRSQVLMLEWSAPPDADPDSEDVWRWALPDWRRDTYRRLHAVTSPGEWQREYLNQWVLSRNGWVTMQDWLAGQAPGPMPDGGVCVIAPARDHSAYSVVSAVALDSGRVRVSAYRSTSAEAAWRHAHAADHRQLYVNVGMRHRDPEWLRPVAGAVGARELHGAIRLVQAMIRDGMVEHDGQEALTEHVLRAEVNDLPGGTTVMRTSTGPIDMCESLVIAVDYATRQAKGPILV